MEKRTKEFAKEEAGTIVIEAPTNTELEQAALISDLIEENEDLLDINKKLIKVIARLQKERKELNREIEWLRDELNEINQKYGDPDTFY